MDNQQGNLDDWPNVMDKYLEVMAYSVGAITGDGSVNNPLCKRDNGTFQEMKAVSIANMDGECLERVCEEINTFFSKEYKIVPYKNERGTQMFRVAINNDLIYSFFHYFVKDKNRLSDEVFRVTRKAKLDFLAGLFDTDGYVAEVKQEQARYGYSWRVGFASRHRTFVEDITRLLQKLGVKVGSIYEQVSGHGTLMFVIKPNIRSFIEAGCYFQIKRKADKLSNYISAMNLKPSETIIPVP
jgi:intein/homing endonuclease